MDHQAVYMSLAHFLKLLLLLHSLALNYLITRHPRVRPWPGLLCNSLNIFCFPIIISSCCCLIL